MGGYWNSGEMSRGFSGNGRLRKSVSSISCPLAEPGRGRAGCLLEGESGMWTYCRKRRCQPLLAHQEGVNCTSHLKVARLVHLCPLGVCVKV